jgi:hypothetical protein
VEEKVVQHENLSPIISIELFESEYIKRENESEMLSDLKLLSGERRSMSPLVKVRQSRERSSSPVSPKMVSEGKSNKSSLFTVDSLLAGGRHHRDNGLVVHEFSDLSPPATPPSPAVMKPLAMPNSPIFPYPFPYPGNLLIPGLPFPHPAAMHSWPGIKFTSHSNHHHHLNESPSSKYLLHDSFLHYLLVHWLVVCGSHARVISRTHCLA